MPQKSVWCLSLTAHWCLAGTPNHIQYEGLSFAIHFKYTADPIYYSFQFQRSCPQCQTYKAFFFLLLLFSQVVISYKGEKRILLMIHYILDCLGLLLEQMLFVFSLSFVQHKLDSSHGFLTLNTHTSHQHTTETPQSSTVTHLLQTALVCPDLLW